MFLAALGLGGYIFLQSGKKSAFSDATFLIFSGLFLLLGRLPVLVFNRELNADESQMLAQAMTLAEDPVYWRSVDGTTGGPLSSYFLIMIAFFRGNYDYVTAHIGALILVFSTLFFLFKAFSNWFGAFRTALGLFPSILFYGFTRFPDFVHYSSEHFPVALIAACVWLTSILDTNRKAHHGTALVLGILLTLVPFGKIQAVPLAAAIAGYLLYLIVRSKDWPLFRSLALGSAGTIVVLCLLLIFGGVGGDFFTYYIQGNFQYKNDTPLWENVGALFRQSLHATDILLPILPLVAFGILHLFLSRNNPASRAPIWLGLGLLVMGVFAASRTGSGYLHYLLFLIPPLSLIATSLTLPNRGRTPLAVAAYLTVPIMGAIAVMLLQVNKNGTLNRYESGPGFNRSLPFTETAIAASRYLNKTDRLAVWGWNCQYYVECAAPQGVAENHSIRSIYDHPMRAQYRERYLRDMQRNQPAVFIDATGRNSLWLQDSLSQSYRSFPELAQYLDKHYSLTGEPDGNRLFVRNELVGK